MKTVYLNIGSNLGSRQDNIHHAVAAVAAAWPYAVVRQSALVESQAHGYESDHRFLNIGLALDFPADRCPAPLDVLAATQAIERRLAPDSPHRNPDGTYRDRCVDIDIIHIDGVSMDTPQLTLPHPRAEARSFVMGPMQFLCPGWHPAQATAGHLKKTIADMDRDTVEEFRAKDKMPIAVVLDNIRSLNNIGSIFRTSDAFAVSKVCLCGISATPPHPQIHKTALGAEESVSWEYYATTAQAVRALQADGWHVACLEQVHGSVPLNRFTIAPGQKTAIVAGNEVSGVDPAIVAMCNSYIEIPQMGTKHSLNVAVSTAIALWHIFSQHL